MIARVSVEKKACGSVKAESSRGIYRLYSFYGSLQLGGCAHVCMCVSVRTRMFFICEAAEKRRGGGGACSGRGDYRRVKREKTQFQGGSFAIQSGNWPI